MRDLVVDALAGYRLTRLLTTDTITEPLRAEVRWRALTGPGETEPLRLWPFLEDLLGCRYCTGVWVGLGVAAARRLAPRAWDPMARALAIAAAAALVARLEDTAGPTGPRSVPSSPVT